MKKTIYAGTISQPKGYKGIAIVVDIPFDIGAVKPGSKALVGFSEKFAREFAIEKWQKFKGIAEVKFTGINSDSDVLKLKEMGVFVEREELKKERNIVLTDEIADCVVIDADTGEQIGTIIEVWDMPANDVWLVKTPEGDLPVPVIDDVVIERDFANKIVKIRLIDGLMDLLNNDGERDDD